MKLNLARVNVKQPVFSRIIPDHNVLNQSLKLMIEDYRASNPKSNTTNVKAWHTHYMLHRSEPKFLPFIDMVYGYIKSLCREHYYVGENIDFACSNFWAMMYEEGDYTLPHIHFPANFSAVYYIDVEPDASPIVFGNSVRVQPENGMLLIFPGDVLHSVPETKGKRTLVSMNFEKLPGFELMEDLMTELKPKSRTNLDPEPQEQNHMPSFYSESNGRSPWL